MTLLIIAFYSLSAVLPIAGLIRLALAARAEYTGSLQSSDDQGPRIAVGSAGFTRTIRVADISRAAAESARRPAHRWKQVKRDLFLVGAGLLFGALGGIFSLFQWG
ncbi:hypothetical protein [Diaminobutyricimonas sp. LJ205]|uniref:hypothetical protein n=1 Tax=Diaminobutyricimonas sp. LJ205 TaxID=2683590 RepID=UPI0012F49CDA|nr:hypothetical protein [Diaminobutyricimonas sp. LJ205]